jgi:hypothetical protein
MEFRTVEGLSAEEAYRKLCYASLSLLLEQYNEDWFVKDVRSDIYLRNELQAFWEGRIQEIHGWNDIIGQLRDWVWNALVEAGRVVWDYFISPAWNMLHSAWDWLASVVQQGFNMISWPLQQIWNAITGIGQFIWNSLSSFGQQVWSVISGIGQQIWSALSGAASFVGSFLSQAGQMILQGIMNIPSAIFNAFSTVGNVISGFAQQIWSSLSSFGQMVQNTLLSGLQQLGQWIWSVVVTRMQEFGSVAWNTLSWLGGQVQNALRWVWDAIVEGVRNFFSSLISGIASTVEAIKQGNLYAIVPLVLIGAGAGFGTALGLTAANLKIAGCGVDTAPLKDFFHDLLKPGRIADMAIGAALAVGIERPLRQHYSRLFRTNLPAVDEAMRMMWREKLSEEEFKEILAYNGLSDKYIEGYIDLSNLIPGASDLVRFVVRECFPLEQLPEAPAEFVTYMKKQGYNELWSRAYWEAHWELPAFGHLQEALWRGIITDDEFKKYVVWHDYKPVPRPGISKSDQEIMFELSYKLPTKMDARWMLKWGIIDEEKLKGLIRAEGVHPDWVDDVAKAEVMNMLTDERSFVVTQYKSLAVLGQLTEEMLREKLKEVNLTAPEIDLIVKGVNAKILADRIDKEVDTAVAEYRYGKITIEELSSRLSAVGLDSERIQLILNLERARTKEDKRSTPEEEVRAFGSSVATKRYVEGYTTDVELEQELALLGYTQAQIARYKILAQLQADYDFAKDILSSLRYAYRRKKIDDTKFIELARRYGVPDEMIRRALSLEKLRMGLGIEEVAE